MKKLFNKKVLEELNRTIGSVQHTNSGSLVIHNYKALSDTSITSIREFLSAYGKVEQVEFKDGMFHFKITDGFNTNAMATLKIIKYILTWIPDNHQIIEKCITNDNLFHLVLKAERHGK